MFAWLGKRALNARVAMCVKEVKWELQNASLLKRATILAMAHLQHSPYREHPDGIAELLDSPFQHETKELKDVYEGLELIRNRMLLTLKQTRKSQVELFGADLPEFAVQHVKTTQRGLEIWMCCVGVGLIPSCRGDVVEVWKLLSDSVGELPHAFEALRQVENRHRMIFGEATKLFHGISDEEWLTLCLYVPSFVRRLQK